jgi:hypothetical protein
MADGRKKADRKKKAVGKKKAVVKKQTWREGVIEPKAIKPLEAVIAQLEAAPAQGESISSAIKELKKLKETFGKKPFCHRKP